MKKKKTFTVILTELFQRFLGIFVKPLIKSKYKPKIHNEKSVPKKGPIVFCANHRHKMDQYFIIIATNQPTHWGAKEEYFRGIDSLFGKPNKFSCALTKAFLLATGNFEIDRKGDTSEAKNNFLKYLNMGANVGLFPEGTRNKTEDVLLPFKFGAVSMAQKSGAWIQPVSITGDIQNKKNIQVNFREPFKVNPETNLEDANNKLRESILSGIIENESK